jgi:hypothetical protein
MLHVLLEFSSSFCQTKFLISPPSCDNILVRKDTLNHFDALILEWTGPVCDSCGENNKEEERRH